MAIKTPKLLESSWIQALIFFVIFLAAWLPRAMKLDLFVTTDEVAWLVRSGNFYYALGQREFEKTDYGHGTITMWIETIAYLLTFPEYRGFGQGYFDVDKYWQFDEFTKYHEVDPHDLLVKSRIITVCVNVVLILLAYYFAQLNFGPLPALIGFLIIAFDPLHISLSRLAHLDGLTAGFLFVSIMAYLTFLHVKSHNIYLVISAVLSGMAWVAKVPGLIIIPTISLLTLIDFLIRGKEISSMRFTNLSAISNYVIKPLVIWGAVLLLSVLIITPAAWKNPLTKIKEMIFSPIVWAEVIPASRVEGKISPEFSENNLQDIASSIIEKEAKFTFLSKPVSYYFRYPHGYLWRVTPIVVIGLLAALVAFILKISIFKENRARHAIFGLIFFVLIFTLFVTLASKSSYKYYLPVYPPLDLIAGLGWYAAVDFFEVSILKQKYNLIKTLILTMVVLIQLISTLTTYPYYATYFNPLLGGKLKATKVLPIGAGEGLDLAAKYLNQKKNSESLKVLSWYGIGPFSYYFNGKSYSLYSTYWDERLITTLKEMDYLVVYSRQFKDSRPVGLLPHLEHVIPEKTIVIDNIEFARLYDVRDLPPDVYQPHIPPD